jgi:hypothetical protein
MCAAKWWLGVRFRARWGGSGPAFWDGHDGSRLSAQAHG